MPELISKADNKPRVESGLVTPGDELNEIGKLFAKYRADKCPEHAWLYQSLLEPYRDRDDFAMLEIGVCRGGSLRAFREFLPQAIIYGIEKKRIYPDPEEVWVYHADQGDNRSMREIAERIQSLDMVIDDGSHRSGDQQVSFEALYPIIKPGGVYVIEDLHVSGKRGFTESWTIPILDYLDVRPERKTFYRCQHFDRDICVIYKDREGDSA